MSEKCLFCKIADGQINANIRYQDEKVVAFEDIEPKAPTHLLIIPRKHINTLNDLTDEDIPMVGYLVKIAQKLAQAAKHSETGYRIVMNCNKHGGQSIFHIHLHLLAGRQLDWPPG